MERTPLTGSIMKLLSVSPDRMKYKNAALIPISPSVAYIKGKIIILSVILDI